MKTIWEEATRREVMRRIAMVDAGKPALWGRMDAGRMVRHCIRFDEWVQGIGVAEYKQSLLGRLFGRMALKGALKDAPMQRNMPAGAGFTVREEVGDVDREKARWTALVEEYAHYSNPRFIHDFFGRMTDEQIGRFVYKHADHHLRQFGC